MPKKSRKSTKSTSSSSSSSSLTASSFFKKNKYETRPKFFKKFGPFIQRLFDDGNKIRVASKPMMSKSAKAIRDNLEKSKPLTVQAISSAQDLSDEAFKLAEASWKTVMYYDPSMKTLACDFLDRSDKAVIIGANVAQDGAKMGAHAFARGIAISSKLARRLLKTKNLKQFTDFGAKSIGEAGKSATYMIRRSGPVLKNGCTSSFACVVEVFKVAVGTTRMVGMKINNIIKAFPIKLNPLSNHIRLPLPNGLLPNMLANNKLKIFLCNLPALLNDVDFTKYFFTGVSKDGLHITQDVATREFPEPIKKGGKLSELLSRWSGKEASYFITKMKKDPKAMQDFNKYGPAKSFGHHDRTYTSDLKYKTKGKKSDSEEQSMSSDSSFDSDDNQFSDDSSYDNDSQSDSNSQSDDSSDEFSSSY